MYLVILALLLFYPGSFVKAQNSNPWLHLEVNENTTDPTLVKVNLPLSMVDVALSVIKDENLKSGRLKLDSHDISVADMRRLYQQQYGAPPHCSTTGAKTRQSWLPGSTHRSPSKEFDFLSCRELISKLNAGSYPSAVPVLL